MMGSAVTASFYFLSISSVFRFSAGRDFIARENLLLCTFGRLDLISLFYTAHILLE